MALAGLAMAWAAVPGTLHAQATTTFDGTYVGVSAALVAGVYREQRNCPTMTAPPTLTIAGGMVHMNWGTTGPFDGPVGPQGTIALQNPVKARLNAQIAQGNISGTVGAQCSFQAVWRKR